MTRAATSIFLTWPLLLFGLPHLASALTISEVLYDAEGSDNGKVFVELFGASGRSLEGFTVEGVNGADGTIGPVLALSGAIPEDGFFVVADSAGGFSEVAGADLLLNFDLQNGPDSVLLRDPDGRVVDALGYGVFAMTEVFAGEGAPAPDAPAGQSLARHFADLDTHDNFSDFGVQLTPTPGFGTLFVPEPGSALLVGGAVTGLLLARRRRAETPPGPPCSGPSARAPRDSSTRGALLRRQSKLLPLRTDTSIPEFRV